MFITKHTKRTSRLSYLMIDHSNVEVEDKFKLIGITIDRNLFFNKYLARLKSSVNQKVVFD